MGVLPSDAHRAWLRLVRLSETDADCDERECDAYHGWAAVRTGGFEPRANEVPHHVHRHPNPVHNANAVSNRRRCIASHKVKICVRPKCSALNEYCHSVIRARAKVAAKQERTRMLVPCDNDLRRVSLKALLTLQMRQAITTRPDSDSAAMNTPWERHILVQ